MVKVIQHPGSEPTFDLVGLTRDQLEDLEQVLSDEYVYHCNYDHITPVVEAVEEQVKELKFPSRVPTDSEITTAINER